jgi:membrane protease YdiL (CAAX protease family)
MLSIPFPELTPGLVAATDKGSLIALALIVGLLAGCLEELGWTGFALPRLRARDGVFATGLLMGILWGVWHLPSQFWAAGDASGALALGILVPELVFALAVLPAYRVLMVWVYEHAHSLLVAMLMHAVLVASLFTMLPAGITGAPFLTCYLVVAVAVWIVVVAVGVATGGQFSRQPLRTRVA